MSDLPGGSGDDRNVTLDSADDDWEWRRKIRSNPHSHLIYRIIVGVVGLIIVVGGVIMVPFPGPGWLVVFLGLAIWASEFEWAQKLMHRAKATLDGWTEWLKPQPWWVKALVLLATIVAVAAIFWLLFRLTGIPGFFPDFAEDWLRRFPGLG